MDDVFSHSSSHESYKSSALAARIQSPPPAIMDESLIKRSTKRPIEDSHAEPAPKKPRNPNQCDETVKTENVFNKAEVVKEVAHFQSHGANHAPSIGNKEEQCESTIVSEVPPKFPQQIEANYTIEKNNDPLPQNSKTSMPTVQPTNSMQPTGSLEIEVPVKIATTLGYRTFWNVSTVLLLLILSIFGTTGLAPTKHTPNTEDHLIPPNQGGEPPVRSSKTLRSFLLEAEGFHLGMAPAFFGYYGYFGALAAWDDELSNSTFPLLKQNIKSVAGASAGAMAAVLIASGISPKKAAEFCSTISLGDFADPPGLLTVFRGDKFEEIMQNFIAAENPDSSLQLQDAIIPVAVSGYDLLTMEGKLLTHGSMARAARASACFPGLFQPVGWVDKNETFLFIDGGLADYAGVNGLGAFSTDTNRKKKRVVNIVVGDFQFGTVLGPSSMPEGVEANEVVSISIQGLPQCGPWAMENGPRAVTAARLAMVDALDLSMYHGNEEGHYELHIDASSYVPGTDEQK